MPLLSFLLLAAGALAAPRGAAPGAPACAAVAGLGCRFSPPGAALGADVPLLVFHRGIHPRYGFKVPESRLADSAARAFEAYRLGDLAEARGSAVLVLGSPSLGVAPADIAALEKDTGLRFSRLDLASFSGGWQGLEKTLDAIAAARRVLMLDNFYFDARLANKVREAVERGAACSGYYTPHNEAGYMREFKPLVNCRVDRLEPGEHDSGVRRCLAAFLDGKPCP